MTCDSMKTKYMQTKLFRVDLQYPLHLVTISFKTLFNSVSKICALSYGIICWAFWERVSTVFLNELHYSAPDLPISHLHKLQCILQKLTTSLVIAIVSYILNSEQYKKGDS